MCISTQQRVRLPQNLQQDDVVAAVDFGLYSLLVGYRPTVIPQGETKQKRINLSPKGAEFLEDLLKTKTYESANETITAALAYIAELHPALRGVRI